MTQTGSFNRMFDVARFAIRITPIVGLVSLAGIFASPSNAGPYNPEIEPSNFQAVVDNPYFPLKPGTVYHYTEKTADGVSQDVQTVTHDTKIVMGVPCVVVRDTLTRGGKVLEDTYDWYAQDKEGNVWYMGEDTSEYKGTKLKSKEGSWEGGVDGAFPGIQMRANPVVDQPLRIEYQPGVAEDMQKVASLHDPITVPAGSYTDVIRTTEWSDLEQGTEKKWYARGVGVVREETDQGEVVTLDSVTEQ